MFHCLLPLFFLPLSGATAEKITVASRDGQLSVVVDDEQGAITEIKVASGRGEASSRARSPAGWSIVNGGLGMHGCEQLENGVVRGEAGAVTIWQLFCVPAEDVPCSLQQAWANLTLTPNASTVDLTVTAGGIIQPPGWPAERWTRQLVLNVTFKEAGGLKLWMPWSRGGTQDALNPSDGGHSWWTGQYVHGGQGGADQIVADHVTVLDPAAGVSLAMIGDPGNAPSPTAYTNLTGRGGAACAVATSCPGEAGVAISHHNLRFDASVTHTLRYTLVPFQAACWRPSLAWSVETYSEYWRPTFQGARAVDGLGSYSSYLGELSASLNLKQMAYQTNWDLSGRFFPYMGQFLPSVATSDTMWHNDVEGTQRPANSSYRSVNAYYASIMKNGFSALSYFNVFEFGLNVVYSPGNSTMPPVPATLNEASWRNASTYMADNFRPALLTNYVCRFGGPCASKDYGHAIKGSAQFTWQKGVVVDPRAGLGYRASLLSQIQRKLDKLDAFQGIVIDRSDWNQAVNLDGDDGHTLIPGHGAGYNMQRSYLEITGAVRERLDTKPGKVMLSNSVGYAWLPFMKPFDGTYSEGGNTNAVGILGAVSTSILWNYDGDDGDAMLQTRLRMGVFPQAPFPDNDHCILPTPAHYATFIRFGPLFDAIKGCDWVLTADPITTDTPGALTNAFSCAGGLVFPIVMVPNATSTVIATVAEVQPGAIAKVLHPGAGATWKPVALKQSGRSAVIQTPIVDGCALLRVEFG